MSTEKFKFLNFSLSFVQHMCYNFGKLIKEVKNMEAPIAELKDRLQEAMNLREKKAADLANDLEIPKSALSQYLSGKSKNMDSVRMYRLCVYLNVNEAWMMGFDVPMERLKEKNSDIMVDITARIGSDLDFREIVKRNFSKE